MVLVAFGLTRGPERELKDWGSYKSLVVDESGHGYLKTVCDYVGYGGTNQLDGVGHNLTCGEACLATGLCMNAGTIVGPQL